MLPKRATHLPILIDEDEEEPQLTTALSISDLNQKVQPHQESQAKGVAFAYAEGEDFFDTCVVLTIPQNRNIKEKSLDHDGHTRMIIKQSL